METNLLFYKIQKGTVTTQDYVNWSYGLLSNGRSSASLNILSSCSFDDNIFEIESYFKRSLKELAIKEPTFEACARAHISSLAKQIVKADDPKEIFNLVDMIFQVVATELDGSDDLSPWIEISELIDRLDYDVKCFSVNERDVIVRIKNEARLLEQGIIIKNKITMTLKRIEEDIENDDLGKARDRLHGLILTYPNELELRKKLGDIYFELKYPAMAGRYWYLEKNKTPQMVKACMEFENSMGHDMEKIVRALKYKGDIELLEGLEVYPALLSIQYKRKEKFADYPNVPLGPTYKWIIFGCLSVIVSIIIFALVGVYTFMEWIL